MSITLSSADLERLARASRLLVSPLDHPTVDAWRSAVNACLRELLHADSAGFLLPVEDGLAMYSEEHDPRELSRFPEVLPPPMADGTPIWEQLVRLRVATVEGAYEGRHHIYLDSAYYNEYAAANGAHDTLTATLPLAASHPGGAASLHFWHASPHGRRFGTREVTLLRLLFPAFEAGVAAQLRFGHHRADLLNLLDAMGEPAAVHAPDGRLVHETPALAALLDAEPQAAALRDEIARVARELGELGPRPARIRRSYRPAPSAAGLLSTDRARYEVRGTRHGEACADAGVVVVSVRRSADPVRGEAELHAEFGLTTAEARVARRIAHGRSNAEIARELCISEHTARRHTERILHKLGVASRTQVVIRLRE